MRLAHLHHHTMSEPPFESEPPGEAEARLAVANRELKVAVGDLRREKYELQERVAHLERTIATLEEMSLKSTSRRKRRKR